MFKNKVFKKSVYSILLTMTFFFSGCMSPFIIQGKTTYDYNIPSQIKLEGVKTVAVLSSRTDTSQTLQALLMEELQKLNVNIIDTQQLIGIVQERKLKVNAEALSQFGEKTNIDLFLVAEVIGTGTTAFKVIERDGRVALARFVSGRTDSERAKNIVNIFTGYKKSIGVPDLGYLFIPGDKNKEEIIKLHTEGKYLEVENKMKEVLANPPSNINYSVRYRFNLANLYISQKRFGDALKQYDEVEKIGPPWINATEVTKERKWIEDSLTAENDAKATTGSLVGYKKDAPNVAVLEFDTKGISDKSKGWVAATYISTKLAQGNFNAYDRDYFRSLIQTESTLSEKEQGELMRVDKLVYGKFLENSPVKITPIHDIEEKWITVENPRTGKLESVKKQTEVLKSISVAYKLSIQGRIVDVKTAFGKFQTVTKEPTIISYPGGKGAPGTERYVEAEWEEKLYDQLGSWITKTLATP